MRTKLSLSLKPENFEKFKDMCGIHKYSVIVDRIIENTMAIGRLSENAFLLDLGPEAMTRIRALCLSKGITVSELLSELVKKEAE